MKNYIIHDPWNIIERGFRKEYNEISESLFSIGNGQIGQRANFEEAYSGPTLQGSYVAGVYYPDKTRVGWWKNGYPEYFAKVLNAANWIGIGISIEGEVLDLNNCEVKEFERILNMKEGYLKRTFHARLKSGKEVKVESIRFCSIVDTEIGAIRYSITPLNFNGKMTVTPYVDADVMNKDSNYDEKFWVEIAKEVEQREGYVIAETKKTAFQVCTGMTFDIQQGGERLEFPVFQHEKEKYVACESAIDVQEEQATVIYKYAANISSFNHPKEELMDRCKKQVAYALEKGFEQMKAEQAEAWKHKWEESDILVEGDVAAQQGIRFNIFHLNQTYTGEDDRLNIGPKGFTGEKYGGSTYWDTEAYCLPFYLATADEHVGRNLLVYRYRHLQKAIENAEKLGFSDGAALYPMVTMNGEECHNEWEITFEEIHRNGAIAYAIYDYINYAGEQGYLIDYGLEVLIGISRFWAQRVHFSEHKQQYVMHGVTGPNEYENNVNNNWYTNYIASWCLQYTIESIDYVKEQASDRFEQLCERIKFYEHTEKNKWKEIIDKMYYPKDEKRGVFLQQDGFLDKELIPVAELDPKHLPLNQNWSWDRILRSCFIKQADVLQGIYFFEDHFDKDSIKRNFDFYEPMTVHESSLSPCVHVILATVLGYEEKAYEMYLRTARLDLDDYNNDTEDGLHITSMAGTWMSIIKGFAGMRVKNGQIHLNPFLPKQWEKFAFKVRFRGAVLEIHVGKEKTRIVNHSDQAISLRVGAKEVAVGAGSEAVS